MSDPSQWNRLTAMEGFPTGQARERTIVPGIAAVRQPLVLLKDEYACPGCAALVERDGSGFFMRHAPGCSVVAAMAEDCRS